MSLIPSFALQTEYSSDAAAEEQNEENSLAEWDVDYQTGQLTGQTVTGRDAIRAWVWKALMTERFRYALYSWNYGSELDRYVGKALTQEYLNTDVRLALEDCLLINEEIKGIRDYSARMDGDTLHISFTVETDYGDVQIADFEPHKYKTKQEKSRDQAILALRANVARFYISGDGRLHWRRPASFDKSCRMRMDTNGELHALQTEAFDKAVDLHRNGQEAEATYSYV